MRRDAGSWRPNVAPRNRPIFRAPGWRTLPSRAPWGHRDRGHMDVGPLQASQPSDSGLGTERTHASAGVHRPSPGPGPSMGAFWPCARPGATLIPMMGKRVWGSPPTSTCCLVYPKCQDSRHRAPHLPSPYSALLFRRRPHPARYVNWRPCCRCVLGWSAGWPWGVHSLRILSLRPL